MSDVTVVQATIRISFRATRFAANPSPAQGPSRPSRGASPSTRPHSRSGQRDGAADEEVVVTESRRVAAIAAREREGGAAITTDDPRPDPLLDASDATLAARARDGDIHAYEVIARRHGPLMRVYAARLLGADADSDDVVQDAFLTAWRRLADLENPAQIRNWLMRIVSSKSIDRLRARREHDDIDAWDPPARRSQTPDRVVEARLQMDAMWSALERLPLDQRRCWLLRETAGYSYSEIAEALGMSVSTVRGRIARARAFLITEMEAWR